MRVRFEKDGTAFEFDRQPLPGPRFRALCLLAAGGIYGGVMVGVASLCGFFGIAAMGVLTVLVLLITCLN